MKFVNSCQPYNALIVIYNSRGISDGVIKNVIVLVNFICDNKLWGEFNSMMDERFRDIVDYQGFASYCSENKDAIIKSLKEIKEGL